MMLALRKTPPTDATAWQRRFAALTHWRLVSQYSHGGIDIGGSMYHVTAADGLHRSSYDPTLWDTFDIGGDDAAALDLFHRLRGAQYDYIGLLGFVLPWNLNDHQRMYCFEWCALAMGLPITARITPERLLAAATQARSSRAFSHSEA